MVICLGRGADLHMAQLMPLPLTISCSSKSRLVLPFWCRLTRIVPDTFQSKRAVNGCVCVVILVHCLKLSAQHFYRVATHLENLEKSGYCKVVRENGKVMESYAKSGVRKLQYLRYHLSSITT